MFPEIVSRVKRLLDGFSAEPQQLFEGKAGGGVSIDQINANWYARNGYPQIYSILSNGGPAWSGESVGVQSALNHSVVWACNKIISESVGFLPLVLMQRAPDGTKRIAYEHPMYTALHDAPNDEETAMTFRETRTSGCVLQGNGFAQVLRRSSSGTAIQLNPLMVEQVTPDREREGARRLVYVVKDGAEKTYTVVPGKPHDILHIRGLGSDGIRGYSVITYARQSIGTAIAAERNVARFYANGGRIPYLLEMENRFKNETDFDKFRAQWETTYSEPHKAPILENGLKYKQIGLNNADAQLLETRQFSIPEICRWFSLSPHMVGDLSRATFSNIEQLALEFVTKTLAAWLTRWEQELMRCVLTPAERAAGYYFKHNLNALLRGDFASRMAGYSTMLQNGIASVDDIRDLEDWNRLPDGIGEGYHIQLNMQALPGATPAAAGAPSLVRLGPNK